MIYKLLKNWDIAEILSYTELKKNIYKIETTGNYYILKSKNYSNKNIYENYHFNDKNIEFQIESPILTKEGKYYIENKEKIHVLFNFIDGKHINEYYNDNYLIQAELIGKTIASFHSIIREKEKYNLKNMDITENIINNVYNTILNNKTIIDFNFISMLIDDFKHNFISLYNDLPKQIIHKDIHTKNILFKNGKISGIIDLELLTYGIRIYDVCYCSANILCDKIDDNININKWFKIFYQIIKAYNSIIKITENEKKGIVYVLYSNELKYIDFYIKQKNMKGIKTAEKMLKWLYGNQQKIKNEIDKI
ncbi:MAG: phosphotransferase [Treponema sp.]|nr:phosphotransferase [Treponema sp.]